MQKRQSLKFGVGIPSPCWSLVCAYKNAALQTVFITYSKSTSKKHQIVVGELSKENRKLLTTSHDMFSGCKAKLWTPPCSGLPLMDANVCSTNSVISYSIRAILLGWNWNAIGAVSTTKVQRYIRETTILSRCLEPFYINLYIYVKWPSAS